MGHIVRQIDYFYATVIDEPGEAYALLSLLAGQGVNLLAFSATPFASDRTRFALVPDEDARLAAVAQRAGLELDGPHPALLVQGDDELGALAAVHQHLADAGINVFASQGVADGRGRYGYVIYVRPGVVPAAVEALTA